MEGAGGGRYQGLRSASHSMAVGWVADLGEGHMYRGQAEAPMEERIDRNGLEEGLMEGHIGRAEEEVLTEVHIDRLQNHHRFAVRAHYYFPASWSFLCSWRAC